jgi:hypothetical protein
MPRHVLQGRSVRRETQSGIVRVYESSAKERTPINVVDIPVTLVVTLVA